MKRLLRRFIRMLGRAWFLILFITAVLGGLFWYYSPLWGSDDDGYPFAPILPRAIVVGILLLLALVLILTIYMLRARREKRLVKDISEQVAAVDPADEALQAELAEMREKLRGALTKLRKSKLGRKSLYELPWYIMIGPPGAGKTTAIVSSGLKFPLADEIGKESVGGVGGTRNCDWWFTENAVLIDTAGRYTTQESDADSDNAGWLGFLALLKKHRPRQPINGALVAISLSDLSLQDEQTQMAHARAVRRRLHELREKLGVRFPVYVVFTKADLIVGFTEYYDDLGKEDREQVWGFTLPLDKSKGEKSPVAAFDEEFGALLGQLNAQLLERMQMETDHQRRSLIHGFPGQVASVRDIAKRFMAEVFVDNRYEQRHILRGVYFTSGTQEGTPIDRLMMGMARTFGLGRQAIGSGQGRGRSYFLTRLFEGVIFPESGLVSADDKVERRYRWSVRGAIAATALVALGAGAVWTRSYLGNSAMLDDADKRLVQANEQLKQVRAGPVADTDFPSIVDVLDTIRDIPANPPAQKLKSRLDREQRAAIVEAAAAAGAETAETVSPLYNPDEDGTLGYGLYQGERLGNDVSIAYRRALNQLLLPRLLLRLESQIYSSMQPVEGEDPSQVKPPDVLYEQLKVYLLLVKRGPMNKDLILDYMKRDWQALYPGIDRDQLRQDLLFHLNVLLSGPLDEIGMETEMVRKAREILGRLQPAERAYKSIIASAAAKELPDFRPSVRGGTSIGRVMMRASGKPMTEGIPGIYTYRGFNDVFLKEAVTIGEQMKNEAFVLDDSGKSQFDVEQLELLARNVLNLYYADYIQQYEGLLGDLNLIPMSELAQAAEVASVLSLSGSPMKEILDQVSTETKLTQVPEGEIDAGTVGGNLARVVKREFTEDLSVTSLRILRALESSTGGDGQPQKPPGQEVEDRFAPIHALVDASKGPSIVDQLMTQLAAVATELNQSIGRPKIGELPLTRAFTEQAKRIGDPIARWAAQLLSGAAGSAAVSGREGLDQEWKANVLPSCQAATALYPFKRDAAGEVGLREFTRVFGPAGLIDKFFEEHLAPIVDTAQRPWAFLPVNGEDLGIDPAVLLEFEKAAEIRTAFFGGTDSIAVSFQITPFALDPGANSVVLEIDGNSIVFTHRDAQPRPTGVKWPGSVGIGRVSFLPDIPGKQGALNFDGFWGWFRLLDRAEIRPTSDPSKRRLNFSVGGRIAAFTMQVDGTNVFSLAALQNFVCPESF